MSGMTKTIRWNKDWKFKLEDNTWNGVQEDAQSVSHMDGGWRSLVVPHDWSIEGPFDEAFTSATAYLPGGIGWYRKRFILPAGVAAGVDPSGRKRVRIRFDGVYNHSTVWCNGRLLGERPYGYSTFSYDVTGCLIPDGPEGPVEQVLAVRADHSGFSDSRWYTGSGITRDVWLTVSDPVHIKEDGVFIQTPVTNAREAEIRIETTVSNEMKKACKVLLISRVLDDSGKEVGAAASRRKLEADGETVFAQSVRIDQPALWSPEQPALYRVETSLLEDPDMRFEADHGKADNHQSGETVNASNTANAAVQADSTPIDWVNGIPVVAVKAKSATLVDLAMAAGLYCFDREVTRFGIRSFSFHPDRGFELNGVNQKLKGVCIHHDAGCFGAAVPKKVWARRFRILKESGCTAIRFSHNPPDPGLLDLCDEMGFLAMDEAFDEWEDSKNKWVFGHNKGIPSRQGYAPHFAEWAEADLKAMVLRDRNHPSIILWSIGNEIDYPNDPWTHEVLGERFMLDHPHSDRLGVVAGKLAAIVRSLDTTRPVTSALADVSISNLTGFADALDVAGYNYLERHYEADHKTHPERVIYGSENSQSPEAWKAVRDNDYICGQFLWTGIDFLGEARGWPVRNSQAGYLDIAGFPKPGFFFRKAMWTNDPMAWLSAVPPDLDPEMRRWRGWAATPSWNWQGREGEEISVLLHTNCPEVELFLDGHSLGRKKVEDITSLPVEWKVPYQAGTLKAKGYREGAVVCLCELSTAGEASRMTGSFEDAYLRGDGEDLTHLEIHVTDADGFPVPDASNLLAVSCEGPVQIIGLENGDPASHEPYGTESRKAHHGKLLVVLQSTGGTGKAVITIAGKGLADLTAAIECI